jgi:hypothetical protein
MLVIGVGLGLTMPLYTLVVQNAVPYRMMGAGTAATQFFRSIGGTLGAAILGSVMLSRYTGHFDANVPAGTPPQVLGIFRNPLQLTQVLPQLRQQFAAVPNGQQLLQALLTNVRDSLAYALQGVFLASAILLGIAFVSSFFLKEIALRKTVGEQPSSAPPPAESPVAPAGLGQAEQAETREPAIPAGAGRGDD